MSIYKSCVFLILCCLFVACKNESKTSPVKSDKNATSSSSVDFSDKAVIDVVCTTGMIGDIVKNVAGNRAKITSLMGPGVDPHLYKATQGDLKRINESDMIFFNGLKLEGKMDEILSKLSKRKPVYQISEGFTSSDIIQATYPGTNEASPDPHIWFDIELWSKAVVNVMKKMVKLDPKHSEVYTKNGNAYLGELRKLHEEVKTGLASIPKDQRILITSHDAFTYFERAYDIEVDALQGISTVTEFGLKDITNLVDKIVDKKIKSIFVESSVAPKSIEAVVQGCKGKGQEVKIGGTLYSDAMGEEGTIEGTYLGMMKHNLKTIVENLK